VQSLQVLEEINRLYFDEYISQWEAFLNDIAIVSLPNLERAEQVLGYLARPDSPLRRFLEAAARETTLATRQVAPKSVAGVAVPGIIGKTLEKTGIGQTGETPVDRRFAGLHRLARPDDSGKAPMDSSLALLKEVHGIIVAQKVIKDQGLPPPPNPADEAVLSRVEADAGQQPQPLGPMLLAVAKGTRAAAREVAWGKLNQIWVGDVAAFCLQALRGRYPLSRTSTKEATQEDFGSFFGPGGKVEGFYRENLEKYLGPYTAPKSNANLPISRETMAMLRNAKIIREVFFRGGGQVPALNFELKPVRMDAQINQFILDVDGQIVRYEHGPALVSRLSWPSQRGAGQVRIQISPPAASGTSGLSEDGPWALFKMLDRARIQPTNLPDRFLVTFDIEGRTATFELRASSVYNPFRLQALERFECSEQL
jgi:type VI secretion system protein ImpL